MKAEYTYPAYAPSTRSSSTTIHIIMSSVRFISSSSVRPSSVLIAHDG